MDVLLRIHGITCKEFIYYTRIYWLMFQISREDFDHEARKLMGESTVHLHNQFLLAILGKCQSIASSISE